MRRRAIVHLLWMAGIPEQELAPDVSAGGFKRGHRAKVRDWMKKKETTRVHPVSGPRHGRAGISGGQRLPESDFKYYIDAHMMSGSRRTGCRRGVQENLAARDFVKEARVLLLGMILAGSEGITNSQ